MKYWIGLTVLILGIFLFDVVDVSAQICSAAPAGLKNFASGLICAGADSGLVVTAGATFAGILSNVMMWLLSMVGVLAIIAFIVTGFMYFTSAGDEEQAKTAKKSFFYALIGLIVALSGLIIMTAVTRLIKGESIF